MGVVDVLFSPHGRMPPAGYWLGVFMLAVVSAVLAYASVTQPQFGMLTWLLSVALIYVYVCVHGKRFHDKGQSAWMTLVPFGVSLLVSVIASLVVVFGDVFATMQEMAQAAGVDTADPQAFNDWAQDPAVMENLSARYEDPEKASALAAKLTIPGQIGFWATTLIFGAWVGTGGQAGENEYGPDPRAG